MAVSKSKKKPPGSVLLSRRRSAAPAVRHATAAAQSSSLSSKAGRALIRSHHTLQKKLSQALSRNDEAAACTLRAEIEASGGLEKYQQASINGQSAQRGGDSSKLLMQWINEDCADRTVLKERGLRMLEVGSLSPDNAVSKSSLFTVTRIDLHSQHPAIETQDFMQRPLPASDDDKFDLVSLSLVLNYVPDPAGRGDMLRRTTQFLRRSTEQEPGNPASSLFPSLFLVLPAPCVTNSRYLDEARLRGIMGTLGYTPVKRKLSAKLIYGLWRHEDTAEAAKQANWKKEEVRPGGSRNNFAVTMN